MAHFRRVADTSRKTEIPFTWRKLSYNGKLQEFLKSQMKHSTVFVEVISLIDELLV